MSFNRSDLALPEFEDWASTLLKSHQIPGTIVALARDGHLIYSQGFGYADVEQSRAIDEQTIFGIGSVTKSFTALAVMQLEEQGLLSVSDPVQLYIPKFRTLNWEYSRATTLHHLLTHTAGLPMYDTELLVTAGTLNATELKMIRPALDKHGAIQNMDELVEFIADSGIALVGAPGEHMSYANDGYALLGSVIERVSGMPYADFIQKTILDPLGMSRTTLSPDKYRQYDNVAALYAKEPTTEGAAVVPSPNLWYSPVHGAAGIFLNTCVRDMIQYLEVFRTGGTVGGRRIVSERSVKKILSQHVSIVPGHSYGYGMSIHDDFYGHMLYEHGGGAKGVSSEVALIPELGLTAVALSNLAGAPSGPVLMGAIHALHGTNPQRALEPTPGAEADRALEKYAGAYANGDKVATVTLVDGQLMLTVSGMHVELKPSEDGVVQATHQGQPWEVHFLFDRQDGKRVSAINIHLRHYNRV